MKSNFEMVHEINTLAKKHYGDSNYSFCWGSAQALLTATQLDLILGMLLEKEAN